MTEEIIGEWLECIVDDNYEIFSEFPYPIRRKGSDKIVAECQAPNEYTRCWLNEKAYLKHRIIAQQFIPNPNNLPEVDHINHNRADNRIKNLRWCTRSENLRNKKSSHGRQYVLIDELPDTTEPLDAYNNHEFDGLWIDYVN